MSLKGQNISVNDVNLNVVVEGEGPPVLLLHGFPDSNYVWRYQIPALLEAGYKVIAPDQRGLGESDAPEGKEHYTIDKIMSDAIALLDALGIQEKVRLIAHDWGAIIGWCLSFTYPERFDRYAALSVGHPKAYLDGGVEQKLKGWYVALFQIPKISEEAMTFMDWSLFRETVHNHPEVDHWIEDMSRSGRLTAAINWYRANLVDMIKTDYPNTPIPVMGIWSTGDVALAEDQMVNSEGLVDNFWRYERVEDASHWLQLDKPDEINALLLDWLSQDIPVRQKSRYMGGDVTLTEAPNGAVTNTEVLQLMAVLMAPQPEAIKLANGIYSIAGLAAFNIGVIEGDTGLIVYDTGDSMEDGQKVLDFIRTISDKPIVGLIYSHSHYVHGARAILGNAQEVPVVGHPHVNRNVAAAAGGGIAGVFAELAPLYGARTAEQMSNFLPDTGPDANLLPKIIFKDSGFVPVTKEVSNGEEFVIDGVRMQAFTEYWSDEDACLTLFLPDHRIVFNNLFWPFMPNLYPLRGDVFRDPRIWRNGIKFIRDLQPNALHNVHGLPMIGAHQINEALNNYMDGITFIFDQTLRGMLKGLDPDELREFVQLPAHLRDFPQLAQVYGEVPLYPPRIYYEAMGWFNRDAANIFPPSPQFEAERIVAGFGGREAVIAAVKEALENQEFAWAARLVNYLFRINPLDELVRTLKAQALREMGRRALGSIPRAFLLGQARALEGKVRIPTVVIPKTEVLSQGNIETLVDYFRVFIDPKRSAEADQMLALTFSDTEDKSFALYVRRGVCEFVVDPASYFRQPDLSATLTRLAWAKLFTGEASARELVDSGEITAAANPEAVIQFLNMFDPFDPADNNSIPAV